MLESTDFDNSYDQYAENFKSLVGMNTEYNRRKKILIVDDDVNFRLFLAELLVNEGYIVSTAKDGDVGLQHLKAEDQLPDLIMLDLRMPVKDGWQFREEQQKMAEAANIPVILISGDLIPQESLDESGVEMVINKPMNMLEVLDVVQSIVKS